MNPRCPPNRAWRLFTRLALLAAIGAWGGQTFAADDADEDQPPPRRLGLIAQVTAGERSFELLAATPVIDDAQLPFDRRLDPATKYSVRWSGQISIQADGKHNFYAHAAGRLRLAINGRELLNRSSSTPTLHSAEPIDLEFGAHAIEVEFEKLAAPGKQNSPDKPNAPAKLSLFWSGPGFSLEPLTERHFSHEPAREPPREFARGEALVRALRCAACHAISGEPLPLAAPALDKLPGNLRREWIVDWLSSNGRGEADGKPDVERVAQRMPTFHFSRDEAAAVAEFLLTSGDTPPAPPPAKSLGDSQAGEKLFYTLGCLACHRLGELGTRTLFDGGDLSRVGEKRPTDFFARWLAEPANINRQHRMPVFELSAPERNDLAAFLSSLPLPLGAGRGEGAGPATKNQAPAAKEKSPHPNPLPKGEGTGRELFERARCSSCHAAPGAAQPKPFAGPRLGGDANWNRACTGVPEPAQARPGYRLSPDDAAAVRAFISNLPNIAAPNAPAARLPVTDGRQRLIENNCVACHAREASPGLAPALTAVAAAIPELAEFVSALTPPSLASVGDKLRDETLVAAIRRSDGNRRPYLNVRMPKFSLSDDDLQAIVKYFVATDRLPDVVADRAATTKAESPGDAAALHAAGARLVTSDGFGCTSCHQVGKSLPVKAPVSARGPDLTLLEKRVRREWFDRWCRDPGRIVPRIEMPAVKVAVRGVLDDDVTKQLAAVWQVLNTPGFQPPEPTVQILRLSGRPDSNEGPETITDILHADNKTYVRPLLIGLPNRHNVLFDCETGRLARWSIGDVARQRTKGKSWFWEAEGEDLLRCDFQEPEITLLNRDTVVASVKGSQFVAEPESIWRTKNGISFTYSLRVNLRADGPSLVRVTQHIESRASSVDPFLPGFRRLIQVNWPLDSKVRVLSPARMALVQRAENGKSIRWPTSPAMRINIVSEHSQFDADGSVVLHHQPLSGVASVTLDYVADDAVDLGSPPPPPAGVTEIVKLDVAPGFSAVRLPLPLDIMPTALAWREDGALVMASLKGRIWLARDTNQDFIEDQLRPFSDEIAAPFGLATEGNDVLACAKYGLLRLRDTDGDDRADASALLASGWGYTDDYHDWTFGLPSDGHGGYFIALACQQDKRSEVAARLRGKVVNLIPRGPTADDPRHFELQVVSVGHRFPTGIARNRAGDLFVTDNQGNYNAFNELNHVRPGKHFGFINTNEQKPDFKPPVEPAAIEIPHPWTRSVNGICFLETPDAMRQKLGRDFFGPYEGHLIGCEYDTRRLIRMSLQKIGDTYQGAAYPLTYETPPLGSEMLGPVCCAVSPAGNLYVGSLRDSGWGAGNNIGEIIRLQPKLDELPPGIAEVRAVAHGFEIDFAAPVNPRLAADPANYSLSSYRRISTPAYGGPDVDRREERIVSIQVSADARHAHLKLSELRPGFVYDMHVKNLAGKGKTFFPAEAYFTLRRIP